MGSEGSFGDVTAQIIRTLYMDGHMVGSRVVQVAILGSRKWGKNEVGWERVARRADLEQSYVLAESTNTDRQRLAISFVICSCFHCDFFRFLFPFPFQFCSHVHFLSLGVGVIERTCWAISFVIWSHSPLSLFWRRRLTLNFAQDKATHSLGVGDKFHYLLPSSGENLNFKFQS